MGRTREIEIEINAASFGGNRKVPPALAALRGPRAIDADAALLQVGLVTRPPTFAPLHLSNTWSFLRYYAAISSESRLSLDTTWDDIDPHQKTILSDDWGMGFATSVLQPAYGVRFWAPTTYLARYASKHFALHRGKAKVGPTKSPDFVGLTQRNTLVVLECKGTQTSRGFSERQVAKGGPQKQALRVSSQLTVEAKLVAGLFVPLVGQTEAPRLLIADPPVRQAPGGGSGPELRAWIARLQLAAELGMLGAEATQEAILRDDVSLSSAVRTDDAVLQPSRPTGWSRRRIARIHQGRSVEVVASMPATTVAILRRSNRARNAIEEIAGRNDDILTLEEGRENDPRYALRSPTGFTISGWVAIGPPTRD